MGSTNPPNINCTDAFGNTALHNASQRGKCEVITLLLQNGCMTTLKNSNGPLLLSVGSNLIPVTVSCSSVQLVMHVHFIRFFAMCTV